MPNYVVVRTSADIDDVMNEAMEAQDEGSKFPGMSYEQGVTAGINWVLGNTSENPMED